MAEDVLACVREPVVFDDITLQVDGSIGIARYPADGQDAQTLLRRADIAMYAAKEERDGSPLLRSRPGPPLGLTPEHGRRLPPRARDQTIRSSSTSTRSSTSRRDRVHGAEALVRWQHPDLGLLQPAAFLEIVEQTGLIGALTSAVLDQCDRRVRRLARRRPRPDRLRQPLGPQPPRPAAVLPGRPDARALHSLPPQALKLEITESMIMSDPQRALATVQSLSDLGVRFAVDDFGTGHSSLANLRRLPVHELKIDRSFVTPMLTDESDAVIVRSTIELGHALGLQVIAEGVEDASTLARLEQIRCDRAQGHYFSKPIPPTEFMRWVTAYESSYVSAA